MMKVVVGITFEAKSNPVYYADLRCAHSSQHDLHELFTHLRSGLYESFFHRIPNIAFTVRLNHYERLSRPEGYHFPIAHELLIEHVNP